jgi:predicted DNA-binding transcriptional regulator YafY
MPPSNLTAHEAFSLLLLVRKAREKLEVPFSDSALRGALKIESNLSPAIREYCKQALKNISVHGTCAKPRDPIDEKFDSLQQAILRKQVLKITYNSKAEPPVTTCDFSPLHLLYTDSWYVMGKLNLGRQIQSIRLKDIEKIEKTGGSFLDEESFNPFDHLGRAWATMPEGTLYNVKLKFAPEIARDVTSVQWHSTQYATIDEDGSALLEFRVDGLGEITWWIISFADKVEVLEPLALRQRIHNMAQRMVKRSRIYERKSDSLSAIMKNISV